MSPIIAPSKPIPLFRFCISLCLLLLVDTDSIGQSKRPTWAFADTPAWVSSAPRPDLRKPASRESFAQTENYYWQGERTNDYYFKSYYYVGNTEIYQILRRYKLNFEPDHFQVLLHEANIWRDGELVTSLDQRVTEYNWYEEKVGADVYETKASLALVFSELHLGDWIEIAYTYRGASPDLRGHLNVRFVPTAKVEYSENYFQLWVPKELPFVCELIHSLEDTRIRYQGEYAILECELFVEQQGDRSDPYDLSVPWPQLICNDFKTLSDLVDLNFQNFDLDVSPAAVVKAQVADLTKDKTSLEQKIGAILHFVQKDIDYLDYGLIKPNSAPTVLSQGFGDCKSKSLLTIKMLESLGIEAWPVLVKSGGIDSALVHLSNSILWDHCIMEYVFAGDTLAFDATDEIQHGPLPVRQTDAFGYGLRIIPGNNSLTNFARRSKRGVRIEATITPTKHDTLVDIDFDITLEGRAADLAIAKYQRFDAKELWRNFRSYVFDKTLANCRAEDISFSFEEELSLARLKPAPFLSRPITAVINPNSSDFYTTYLFQELRLSTYFSKHSSFRTPDFGRIEQVFKLLGEHPSSITPDTIAIKKDWIHYFRRVWKSGDTLYAHYSAEILKDIIPNGRYEELEADLEAIHQTIDPDMGFRSIYHSKPKSRNEILAESNYLRKENKKLARILGGTGLFIVILLAGIGFNFWRRRQRESKA